MNKLFKIITALIIAILIQSALYADVTTTKPVFINDEGNVTSTSKKTVMNVVIVDNYDLGGDASTTKVYNEAEGTTFYDGAIRVSGYENIIYHVDLKTLGSTTVTLTFEAKIDDDFTSASGNHMLLWTAIFTATNTGYPIELQENNLKWVSVGMVSDDGGTDDITIKMTATRKKK